MSDVDQITVLSVVNSGSIVTLNSAVSLALSVTSELSSTIDSAKVGSTITLQVADKFEPSVVIAIIVASPTEIAVTKSFSSTIATDSSDDIQTTDLSVVNSGSIVTLNSAVSLALSVISELSSTIDSAKVGSTITLQVADKFEPSAVTAVIVASPTEIAVTKPFASTVATALFEDDQITDLSVVNSGSTVAVNSVV